MGAEAASGMVTKQHRLTATPQAPWLLSGDSDGRRSLGGAV